MFIKNNTATILINGEVTPEMGEELSYFIYGVQHMDEIDTIEVNICSGGGSVIAGYAIYSALLKAREDGKKVITNCEGICASIAGIIFLAGEIKRIRNYGLVMIHNPSGGEDKTLQKIKQSLKVILNDSFKGDLDELMNDETWYDANQLSEMGLVNEVIDTEFELDENIDLTTSDKIKNHYEICNDILKNNINEMSLKDYFKKKEDNKLNTLVNAEAEEASSSGEATATANEDAVEAPETPEEEQAEEDAFTALDARVTALEQLIQQLTEANASVIAENNALKTKKEDEVKSEILNKAGIEKKDFDKWMKLDLNTLTNLASTIKVTKVAPVIVTKNAIEGLTQDVFNSMTKEQKETLMKTDKDSYWKFFKGNK
jgi:ATP-dependent protease ClpP protease subunit